MQNEFRKIFPSVFLTTVIISSIVGGGFGLGAGYYISKTSEVITKQTGGSKASINNKILEVDEESATISVVKNSMPAVVSIIVSKDLPVYERFFQEPFGGRGDIFDYFSRNNFLQIPEYRQNGTEKREIGGGTGFIISSDGYIVTNKHVVEDEDAEYTVLLNDEEKYEAKILARDPLTDLAVIKIEGLDLPYIKLGDSANLQVGQTVIAIGNSLGEFKNTVSRGVISGMLRSIVAGGSSAPAKQLAGLIQTDASINPGNSGGPLINLEGQVIGINTAMAQGAENIGFTIPINDVKKAIEMVKTEGRIIRPWLGIRYVQIDEEIKEKNKLTVDYGALIIRGKTRDELAVLPDSPADKAGLEVGDIILEINGKKLGKDNFLAKVISEYSVGDKIELKIIHKGRGKTIEVELEEMK